MKNTESENDLSKNEEYSNWLLQQNRSQSRKLSRSEVREKLIENLSFIAKMEVQEYILYRKWDEMQRYRPAIDYKRLVNNTSLRDLYATDEEYRSQVQSYLKGFRDKDFRPSKVLESYKEVMDAHWMIWNPNSLDEMPIEDINPVVVPCRSNKELTRYWNLLRTYTCTMINNSNVGRNLYFIVQNGESTNPGEGNRVLGLFCLSSDYLDLAPRDKNIGWSRDVKSMKNMIQHTAAGSTIIPTQPFGFNYVGGKLISLLVASDVAENAWNERYDNENRTIPSKLVGVTTTSLYGSFSQYDSLKYWKSLGHSTGSAVREPNYKMMLMLKEYMRQFYPQEYWQWFEAKRSSGLPLQRDAKQRALRFLFRELDVEKELLQDNDVRGVYFCPFYDNYKEFLRAEIDEDKLVRRAGFDNSVEALTKIWKEKYAYKRIAKLQSDHRIKPGTLFYDDLVLMSWDDAKDKYLAEVGR